MPSLPLWCFARRTRPIPPDVTFTAATAPPALRAQMQVEPPARRTNEAAAVARPTLPGTLPGAAVGAAGTPTAATAAAAANASGAAVGAGTPTAATAAVDTSAAANASEAASAVAAVNASAAANASPAANASGVAASLPASQVPAIQQVPVSTAAGLGASSDLLGAQQPVAVTRTASVQPTVTGRRLLGRAAQRYGPHVTSQQYSYSQQPTQQYSYSQQPGQQYSQTSSYRSGRQLLVLQDELDSFRRADIREQCAEEAAADWRPYLLFNLTDDITTNPRYSGLLQGGDVVAVISEASANLNRMRAEAPVQQFPPVTQPQPQPAAAVPAAAQPAAAAAPTAAAGGGETAAAPVLPAGGAAVQALG